MISDYKSDDLGVCCTRCCIDPTYSDFEKVCPDSPDGKHHFLKWEPWVAISHTTLYGVRNEQRALKCFAEQCGGSGETARKLTPEEFTALRTGKARLIIRVEAIA